MMTVNAIPLPGNRFNIETSDPVNGRRQFVSGCSESDALRFTYTWTKLYITEQLTKWLHQRYMALKVTGQSDRAAVCLKVIGNLSQAVYLSSRNVCALVLRDENSIRFVAPGEKSKQYPFYERVICDILAFCRENAA